MLIVALCIYVLSFSIKSNQILLYNTENDLLVTKFDCIYDTHNNGQAISYCQRPRESFILVRNKTACENGGEQRYFRQLLDDGIEPNEVLKWSSDVEMADLYASFHYNRSFNEHSDDYFICQCKQMGTFGKYCEYQFTHNTMKFSEAIQAQFRQKEIGDSWNTQRYGDILCYETLPCDSSPLCLDWHEICDGVQRCSNGIDEENCDKLEFNECEDDEFRCTNGMCIAEEFWFDGDRDCMDWSDEYLVDYGRRCPFTPNMIECDEHLCPSQRYSCGDGECVEWMIRMAFQRLAQMKDECFTKRNLNYMCEVSRHRRAWTLENGLCWPDDDFDDLRYPSWNIINHSNLTNQEICYYLFRCLLSDNFEHDCPCSYHNCKELMMNVCLESDQLILYPPRGLINANYITFYNYRKYHRKKNVDLFELENALKCQGYSSQIKKTVELLVAVTPLSLSFYNQLICSLSHPEYILHNFSSHFQYDKFCWNDSLTFNGRPYAVDPNVCADFGQCISQYRIRDGTDDCISGVDEHMILKNYCTGNVGRQHFQCYNDQHNCLTAEALGSGSLQCSNNYDESFFGSDLPIRQDIPCHTGLIVECYRMKEYIRQSSMTISSRNHSLDYSQRQKQTNRLPFRWYCDSFWDTDTQMDELPASCRHWTCQSDQYQCRTGQCIKFDWLCDGEWDCADASDEEAFVLMETGSFHNARHFNLSTQLEKCQKRYSQSPFHKICNVSFQFGCLRSNVFNPLDIQLNIPCINLTQIGDGIEDCYNAYDEKNTFIAKSSIGGMWGFHYNCANNHEIYTVACSTINTTNCTDIICSKYRDKDQSCSSTQDFICFKDSRCVKNGRCNGDVECSEGEDEYWCPSGSVINQQRYRFDKSLILREQKQILDISLMQYPNEALMTTNESRISQPIVHRQDDELFQNHSYLCNRGISIFEMKNIQCLCPPPYYGSRCQFFSDRISVIVHLDRTMMSELMLKIVLKIKVNFLFNEMIVDQHEFHVLPTIGKTNIIKHKFYLLYSRSNSMTQYKFDRYFNRTDIIANHPYSIHFTAFALNQNNSVEEIGSWHYPFYFDYLPAFRLAIVLKFPSWFEHATLNNPCSQNNCSKNSICLPIFNQNQSFYCSCLNGYHGVNCSTYESRCDTYCAPNAFCRPRVAHQQQIKERNFDCLCPLGHFGSRCNLKYHDCNQHSCLNGAHCSISYDPSGEQPFICRCSPRFYGNRCEYRKESIHVELNMTTTIPTRATVLQLYDITLPSLTLQISHQKVYEGLPSNIIYYHAKERAPVLGILKTYDDLTLSEYFIMYVLNQSMINITSSPQQCPHISTLSLQAIDRSIPFIFQYHRICQNDTQQFCFYDENYLCLCQSHDSRAECFLHNLQLDHCDQCFSGGKCLQGNPNDRDDFLCLCPACHQGPHCEFNLEAFGFTVDSLLVRYSTGVKILYLSFVVLLFTIGFLNNFCSFITFKRTTPRKFGTGTYLLIVTCFNQLALFCLLAKFIQIISGLSSVLACKLLSYLLSVCTRSTYWLTSCVTVDRILIILLPNSLFLKNARIAIRMSLAILIILFSMHIHEIIFYTTVPNRLTGASICVTDLGIGFVSIYNRISTPIHYIMPFLIQTISITLLIVFATRSRVRATKQKTTFYRALKTQFENQKELYITPVLVIFSILPQVIVTFSFACRDLNEGERHILLCAYLLSYAPQVLGFVLYVLPSTTYRKEFGETSTGKKFSKWMVKKEKMATVVAKTNQKKL